MDAMACRIVLASPLESGGSDGNPAKRAKTLYSKDGDLHENQQAVYGNGQTRPNKTNSLRPLTQRHVTTSPSPIPTQLEPNSTTTTATSNTVIEQWDSEELARRRGQERVRRIEEDEARGPEAEQQEELDRGE